MIRTEKTASHTLVTHGVYKIFRHPSYFGWFYWALSCQILLMNPVCIVLFPIILWKFFSSRIVDEEGTLVKIFGDSYVKYKEEVMTCGIPFIWNTPVEQLPRH